MKLADIPTRFDLPWGADAGGSYIRAVPVDSQIGIQNGAASLTDGFPPLTFTPIDAGGVPPFGEDMNGILNQITAWTQASNAGIVAPWDAAFSTAIGGYPNGAIVQSTATTGKMWISTLDDNTSNPDAGGANWSAWPDVLIQAQAGNYILDTGAADIYVATLVPAITAYALGVPYRVKIANTNTGACTLNINAVGAKSIKARDGSAPRAGDIPAGATLTFYYNGTNLVCDELAGQRVSAGISDTSTSGSPTLNVSATGIDAPFINSSSISSGFVSNPSVTIPLALTNNGTALVIVTEGVGATSGLMGAYLVSLIGSATLGPIVLRLTGSNDDCTVTLDSSARVVVSATGTRLINAALIRLSGI